MKKNLFYFFFILFFIVLSLGCIETDEKEDEEIVTDGISSSILINGVQSRNIDLISEQRAEVGVRVKNFGDKPIENVTVKLIGYLNIENHISNETDRIFPNTEHYFNWLISAPRMRVGERISTMAYFRICFDYDTISYSDVITIPEAYGAPPTPYTVTESDYLDVLYNIPATRMIEGKEDNRIVGEIIIRNIGEGDVDYPVYIDNPSRNILRTIEVNVIGLENATIGRFGGERISSLEEDGGVEIINDTKLIISHTTDKAHLLRVIRGQELRTRIEITIPDSEEYQKTTTIGGLEIDINHGYCINTPTISMNLRG